jgi:hypothetical protein
MTGSDANAANELGQKPQVEVVEIPFSELPKTVPPVSINSVRAGAAIAPRQSLDPRGRT